MAPNRITRGRRVRRALLLGAAALALAAALGACGGGSTTAAEREQDAETLNDVLGRQLAAVEAYGRVLPRLRGHDRAAAEQFRAQEQEHVDSTTKTLRGLGAAADPASETIEAEELKTRAESLEFLYAMESATIERELSAVSELNSSWPRPLLASMAANQAQHLVLLRQALGAKGLEAVPSAFENGATPAPEATAAE